MNFPHRISRSNRWWINEDVSIRKLGILGISPLTSFILALGVVLVANWVISGILSSIYLILALYTSFLTTPFLTTSLSLLKVAPRVEKTEVFRKGWNFANRTYFASCIMRKYYFLLWTKETAFFPHFYHGIISYSAELSDCTVNFKFYIFIFLNTNTNQTSKELHLN